MERRSVWAIVLSVILTLGLAMPVYAEETIEQEDINIASITEVGNYLMDETPENIVSTLNMTRTTDWQFGGAGKSYSSRGFYVVWDDSAYNKTAISAKSEGNSSVSIFGISCGTNINRVNEVMKAEGWYPGVYMQQNSISYIKETSKSLYMFELTLDASGNIQQWYWNNWPQGIFWEYPFEDVSQDSWYYDAVMYTNNHWIMTGMENRRFGPSENLARAQFATILYRMEGSPGVEYMNKFPDVSDGMFYSDAVIWANRQDIVGGYSNGNFGPGDNINREQMAVMMYRYAKYKRYDVSAQADLSGYPDKNAVNDFAKEAMQWAVGVGLITGNRGNLLPQGNANRAECATIIMRFMQKYS